MTRNIDSLTDLVEREVLLGVPADSIRRHLHLLEASGADEKRMLFLRARFMRFVQDYDSSKILMAQLFDRIDSVRDRYLWMRVKLFETMSQSRQSQKFLSLNRCLDYFTDINDSLVMANILVFLSIQMSEIRDYESALDALDKAQNIYRKLGLPILVSRSNINRQLLYKVTGNKEESDSIFRLLLADESLYTDTMAREDVLRNAFLDTDSVDYLLEAMALTDGKTKWKRVWALHNDLLGEYMCRHSKQDSGLVFIHRAKDFLPFATDMHMKSYVHRSYAMAMEREGKLDSAIYYLKLHEAESDSILKINDAAEVHRMEMQKEVLQLKANEHERLQTERMKWMVALMLIVFVAVGVGVGLYRNHQKSRLREIESQLKLEQNRRHLAARLLAIEEKDKLLDTMTHNLREIREHPADSSALARDLENMIKLHVSGQEEWHNFITIFEKVNPGFMENLKKRAPSLADNYVKLASYIYAGLPNNQIARLLMVKPESVHQARWRLRRNLQIPSHVTIEDALRMFAHEAFPDFDK